MPGVIAPALIMHQQMDVVRGDDVIEHTQNVALFGLEEPRHPAMVVAGEFRRNSRSWQRWVRCQT
jgi:hypothetical protein